MIVSQCRAEGCNALTIGSYCVEHDSPVTRIFVRGRPFVPRPARWLPERGAEASSRRPVRRSGTVSA
jgi:hypothetical protein